MAKKNTKKYNAKVLVLSGYGLNCEEETKFAFDSVGGEADIIHINDLISEPSMLHGYDILAFPEVFLTVMIQVVGKHLQIK